MGNTMTVLMKHYKDPVTNDIYAYVANGSEDDYIKEGLELLSDEELALLRAEQQQPPVTPSKVTMRQARLALHASGLLSQVEVAINTLPEPPRTTARIEWDFSSEVHRDKEFVVMMGTALGLSDAQLDDLFVQAALL